MNAFQKTAITTVVAVIVLITVGSLVRVAGAGLGCRDWPLCWGSWLPPASIEEIDMAYIDRMGCDLRDFNPARMWNGQLYSLGYRRTDRHRDSIGLPRIA